MKRLKSRWIAPIFVFLGATGPVHAQERPRADRYGDPLPDGVIARLGTVRLHFGGEVSSAAVSPDGSILIAAGRVCDGKTGKELPQFKGKYLAGNALFSEDMTTVAIGKSNGIERWEIATGNLVETNRWKEKWDYYDRGNFTPDLKYVVISSIVNRDSGAAVMEMATRKTLFELKEADGVVLSPEGKKLAAMGRDATVVLWDVVTKKEVRRWKAHERTQGQIYQFSPDGKTLASSVFGREIRFWEVEAGKMISEIKSAGGRHLLFSPDGKAIVYDDGDKIHMYDIATGKETRRFVGHGSWLIPAMSFSANGKYLASASRDHTVILWDVATGKSVHDFEGHRGSVACLAFSPKGGFLASGGGEDHAVIVWDIATHKPLHFLRGHDFSVNCLAISPDGKRIATGDGSGGADREAHIRVWDADNGKLVRKFFGHMDAVSSVAFFGAGKGLATTGGAGRVRIWEVETGERLHQIRGPFSAALKAKLDAQPFAEMKRWNVKQWEKLDPLAGPQTSAGAIGLHDGRSVLVVVEKRDRFEPASFEAQVRDAKNGDVRRTFPLTGYRYHQMPKIALSPDETTLAAASPDFRNPIIHLYDVKTGDMLTELRGHTGSVVSLAFSPDSKRLASGSSDTTVLLWDVPRAKLEKANP